MVAYDVATMYIDTCKTGRYVRHLLRENYREGGQVRHRTIANLSSCSEEEIAAIKLALKHKGELQAMIDSAGSDPVEVVQGTSMGATWLVYQTAKRLGIVQALGPSRDGRLALWQVMARVIDQGSRLSAVRLAADQAACEIVGIIHPFNEDDLYANLDWLTKHQQAIESRLFGRLYPQKTPELFLYDVTSSYLEGVCNELSAFGYNRDGKKGKKQVVIGLLCDQAGRALSIEVFAGNTQDPKTVASQIRKTAGRFGCRDITFVGDRGMIKSQQIEDLHKEGFHYITAITKPQIQSLLNDGLIQMELFDESVAEVTDASNIRYILRRNPKRAFECQKTRESKWAALDRLTEKKNAYLREHPRARVDVAVREIKARAQSLKIHRWVEVSAHGRMLAVTVDEQAQGEQSKLDGCYVIKTDLSAKRCSKQDVHDRYTDLTKVERAFRTSKTVHLEMRPINVRLAIRTRGHALVVMLAYRIVQELARCWVDVDTKVEEGINQLRTLCVNDVKVAGSTSCSLVPTPRAELRKLLSLAKVRLPASLPKRKVFVATRKKLPSRRKSQ